MTTYLTAYIMILDNIAGVMILTRGVCAMTDILKQYQMKQQFVSVYFDSSDSNRFQYGKILAVNGDFFAMRLVAPNGTDDGVLVALTKDVLRVETESLYDRKMAVLMHSAHYVERTVAFAGGDLVRCALTLSLETKAFLSLEIAESGYADAVGYIVHLSDDICTVRQFDEYGREDGKSDIRISDITNICMESEDEKIIKMLAVADAADISQ